MFEIKIQTDNPEILIAIANAIKSVPPVGLEIGKPVEVNVHASMADMKAATENVNLADNAVVKEVEPEETAVKETPTDERNERRSKLRKLVTAAGEKMEGGIPAAMAEAIKVSSVTEAKDLPDCDNFDAVCNRLTVLITL